VSRAGGERFRVFRWRAVGPLLLFLLLLGALWAIFGDWLVRGQVEGTLSETLGTEVDLASLRIREADVAVDLGGLQVADPRDPARNLLEAGTIVVDLDPVPLTEKKLVVDQLTLSGLRFGTTRSRPARPASPDSPAARLLEETRGWARDKFRFPALALGRVDSLKNLVLNPDQLITVKAAAALAGRADSTGAAFAAALDSLALKPLGDSALALADRLGRTDPKTLGVAGTKDAVTAVQRTLDGIKQAKSRLQGLEQAGRNSIGALEGGLRDLEASRQRDYALARGLLQLPSFEGPNISASLFGGQSTDYFQLALYYAKLLERYLPPGLQPWNRPGPPRARLSGTDVEFPKEHQYPRFLLRDGKVDLRFGRGGTSAIAAQVAGLTTQPALYGRPTTFQAAGRLAGELPITVDIKGLADHRGKVSRDSLTARLDGVTVPGFDLPGLPLRLEPGRSRLGLGFSLQGDRIAGRWEITSANARWTADPAKLAGASPVERTVWRVVSGLKELEVRAELGGTIASPSLTVSSNLEDALASQLRALVGDQIAGAERKAREAVDRIVDQQVGPARDRVAAFQTQALSRLPVERGRLDGVQQKLEGQLKRLTAGAGGLIKLPKL
jgi:uncharacterized protein (TIGR03545 family)